ncbi:CA1AA-like protein [Mya arenaria]|uniref:CA1AA-like protein n=1 Tax=Mya arenaria TaxID=6604 RepID=A0ABY7DKQ3_MYAAR|nr:chromatin assembly factor 1 subunit A-like [Mya arenaria]WAQ97773.1 CA1AA-like protein [Mya arenaria]
MMETMECPPSKKLKQGRLPFKPLDPVGQTRPGGTPPGCKKRKLSDNESPSAKQIRTSVTSLPNNKLPSNECDHEVSSSSEAEVALENPLLKPGKKLNTLDKFFAKKQPNSDQGEISSTNQIEIDLTDDVNEESEDNSTKKVNENDIESKTSTNVAKGDNNDNHSVNDEKKEQVAEKNDDSKDSTDNKENDDDGVGEVSFIQDSSVCEDALKTPAKEKGLESIFNTPAASGDSASSTPAQNSASGSECTQSLSDKKKSKSMSESKKKERDEQRQRAKEEKEREREERKKEKEREREEKKRELTEKKKQKEEQKEKEKAEKEKARLEEKEKKEKERQDKLKQKEEEKRMKDKENEAKLEEKRQKEEERKKKDEEKRKEEEEKQKLKEKKAEKFKGFFIQKDPSSSPPKPNEVKEGLFMPFECMPHMKLAPSTRRQPLTHDARTQLDKLLNTQICDKTYVKSLKSAEFVPGKSLKTWPRKPEEDDDVEMLSHDAETIKKVTHRVKFLKFRENNRPAYYGTWSKISRKLSARNPFRQDEELLDYEVDSDDEWEEEEPGESVSSDEEDGDEEKVMEDMDPDADDWMVPHGYLSDDEGLKDEEEVDQASKQDLQRVRQAAWESELKRQAKPLKMIAIGCVWEADNTTTIAAQQLETLLKFKAVCLMEGPIDTSLTGSSKNDRTQTSGDAGEGKTRLSLKAKAVPEEGMTDLIRLVHGNPMGMKNMVKEFQHFWQKKVSQDSTGTDQSEPAKLDNSNGKSDAKSANLETSMEVGEKGDKVEKSGPDDGKVETQDNLIISKRQLDKKILAIACREKRPDHKKVCWYVNADILKQYGMEDIQLPNSWEYVKVKAPTWAREKTPAPKPEETATPKAPPSVPKIMQFAQPMSPAQIQAMGTVANKDANKESKQEEDEKPVKEVMEISAGENPAENTPSKPVVPPDQRSIIDMFSPAARKALNSSKKKSSPNMKKTSGSIQEKSAKEKADAQSSNEKTPAKHTTPKAGMSPGLNLLNNMMSSPELMKKSPKQATLEARSESTTEEPMDVDIIVLD